MTESTTFFLPFPPPGAFFLQYLVSVNYAGKVYCVLKCVEELADGCLPPWVKVIYSFFLACMLLGTYWYTRFWPDRATIDTFLVEERKPEKNAEKKDHGLHFKILSSRSILLLAMFFYLMFAVLFFCVFAVCNITSSLVFGVWCAWCALNLALSLREK